MGVTTYEITIYDLRKLDLLAIVVSDETSLIFVMVRARLYDSVMTLKVLRGKLC